jgi:VanZ family protein
MLFLALTLLVDLCRWAIAPRWFLGLLTAYAIAVELLQAVVPPRTVEALDLVENLLGVAVGTAAYWAATRNRARPEAGRQQSCPETEVEP